MVSVTGQINNKLASKLDRYGMLDRWIIANTGFMEIGCVENAQDLEW